MRDFFKGWKRKIGSLTLLMACVFIGAWMRGFLIQDSFLFEFATQDSHLSGKDIVTRGRVMDWLSSSARDGLVWTRERSAVDISWVGGWRSHPTESDSFFDQLQFDPLNPRNPTILDYHWQLFGFDIGRCRRFYGYDTGEFDTFSFWRISYSSVVVTLTLISAWLLLTKPRKSTLTKTAQRTSNEGGAET